VAPIDWTILTIYCCGILALALRFRKRAGKSVEDYFVAGRDLPWWVIGFADVAGYTGGGQGFLMVLFLSGFAGLWLMAWISWVIWMPLVAVIWAPMWRRLGVVTTGEFIERRYAGRRAKTYRSVYAVYACVVWGLTSIAYGAAWMGATAAPVLGWKPSTVVLAFGGFTILYSLISGLLAVAYNDVAQFVILVGGNLVFGLVLLSHAGGWRHALAHVTATRGAGLLSPFPGGHDLNTITLLALVVQGLFFAGSPFAGEGWTAQRFMAARDERHAVRGQIANGILALVVRLIPFILCAIAAASLYPVSQVAVPAALWGDLVKRFAPPGLFGLLLVSSLAGYMAAISSIGNWAASYIVNDLYRTKVRPQSGEKEAVRISRLVSGVLLAVAFLLGGLIRPQDLDRWILFINSSLIVFSLPLAWLKWFWWRTNAVGDMVGILGGFPAGYLIWFGSDAVLPSSLRMHLGRLTGLDWNGIVPAFSDLNRFPFWMGFAVLFLGGAVCILLATLLTRSEPMETLESFYRSVRPVGLWGPVRRSLAARGQEPAPTRLGSGLVVSAYGMFFYFCLCISLFAFCGDRLFLGACTAMAAAALGVLFARSAQNELAADTFKSLAPVGEKVEL
jgi:solute:Na+ symporter, SSS family